jgi:5'-nucleotidase
MNILLSNDDGFGAVGLECLFQEINKISSAIVIAPHQERSSCGHGITLHEPLRINKVAPNHYECSGTPADCILIGLGHVCKKQRPDLVISGINNGANLGQDRYYSGTIAAAREACFREVPSIAVSLVINRGDEEHFFNTAAKFVSKLVGLGVDKAIPPMCLLNINVPNCSEEEISGAKITFPGFQKYSEEILERIDFKGKKYFWVGGLHKGHKDIGGSDCNSVNDKFISLNIQCFSDKHNVDTKKLEEIISKLDDG